MYKTQINTIVNGSKILIGEKSIKGGTNHELRREIFKKVAKENNGPINLIVDGVKCTLFPVRLCDEETIIGYRGLIHYSIWNKWIGTIGLNHKTPKQNVEISLYSDCSVHLYGTGKSRCCAVVQNNLITIE